jgi:Predicted oxidoreductases (related to aryl-alcohol dehydrogenases)
MLEEAADMVNTHNEGKKDALQTAGAEWLRVSELCLGTMTFGEDWGGVRQEESRKVYDTFLEAGGNFIDTANVYTNGTSERLLGEFMQGQRERIVLATKYTNAAPEPIRTPPATTARAWCRRWKPA